MAKPRHPDDPNPITDLKDRDGVAFKVLDGLQQEAFANRMKALVESGLDQDEGLEKLRHHLGRYEEYYYPLYDKILHPEYSAGRPGCVGLMTQIYEFLRFYVRILESKNLMIYKRERSLLLKEPRRIFAIVDDFGWFFSRMAVRLYEPTFKFSQDVEEQYLAPNGLFANPELSPREREPQRYEIEIVDSDDDTQKGGLAHGATERSRHTPSNVAAGPSTSRFSLDDAQLSNSTQDAVMDGSDIEIQEMSEKRKGKQRALSDSSPDPRTSFPQPATVSLSGQEKPRVLDGSEEALDWRERPSTSRKRTSDKETETCPTRRIRVNRVCTAYKKRIVEPEPANDSSEQLLYRHLFGTDRPPSRKEGATFALVDFRVVLKEDESKETSFTDLVGHGPKTAIVVLGKAVLVEGIRQKEELEDGKDSEGESESAERGERKDSSSEPRDGRTRFVRLIGGIDFRTVTLNSGGFRLESRSSTYELTQPHVKYARNGFLDAAVELANLWSLARWTSIGGFKSAEELAKEVTRELRKEKKRTSKHPREWQEHLPKWCHVPATRLQPTVGIYGLLFETLPNPPFVTQEVYKLVHRYFPPKAFRTTNRDAVEEEHKREVAAEKLFLESIRETVSHAGAKKMEFPRPPEEDKNKEPDRDRRVKDEKPGRVRQHPRIAKIDEDEEDSGQWCDISEVALLDGEEYKVGDTIAVVGKNSAGETHWIAKIEYFLSYIQHGDETKEIHVSWFATPDTVPSLGPYLSRRHLFLLEGSCDTISPDVVAGKVEVKELLPGEKPPPSGFYTRFVYSELDGSITSVPNPKTGKGTPFCEVKNLQACNSCEEQMEASRLRVPFLVEGTSQSSFRFGNEIYHLGDLVFLEPIDPDAIPPDSDLQARIPLRLARLLSIECGEEDGHPDSGRLGHDATIGVEWIYRREELGSTKKTERVFGREVLLSDVREDDIAARRLRGRFHLEHVETVLSLSSNPREAHGIYNSDPICFWTNSRLDAPTKPGQLKENASYVRRSPTKAISKEQVDEFACTTCRLAHARKLTDSKRVSSARDPSLKLANLAVYAGAGLLDLGVRAGCPLLEVPYAVEKNEAAAEIFRNGHASSLPTVLCEPVSDVFERQHLGNDDSMPRGSILSMTGGSPCQGFSSANRHRRDDDPRTFEPFVFANGLSLHRPLTALFENVARFREHALPHPAPGSSKGSFAMLFLSVLVELGYQLRWSVYQAAEYGAPQSRRRFIVQAAAQGFVLPDAPIPTTAYKHGKDIDHRLIEHGQRAVVEKLRPGAPHRAVTVYDISTDLPRYEVDPDVLAPSGYDWDDNQGGAEYATPPLTDFQLKLRITHLQGQEGVVVSKTVTQHVSSAVSKEMAERMLRLGLKHQGKHGNHEDLRGLSCYPDQPPWVRRDSKRQSEWYRRLRSNEILATLRTTMNLDSVSQGPRIHPDQARSLSVRELLRAQGAPDTFELFFADLGREPTFAEVYRVIGNGVPVPLAEAFGRKLLQAMTPLALEHLDSEHQSNLNLWEETWKKVHKPL